LGISCIAKTPHPSIGLFCMARLLGKETEGASILKDKNNILK
jgi:hypothetical protein